MGKKKTVQIKIKKARLRRKEMSRALCIDLAAKSAVVLLERFLDPALVEKLKFPPAARSSDV